MLALAACTSAGGAAPSDTACVRDEAAQWHCPGNAPAPECPAPAQRPGLGNACDPTELRDAGWCFYCRSDGPAGMSCQCGAAPDAGSDAHAWLCIGAGYGCTPP